MAKSKKQPENPIMDKFNDLMKLAKARTYVQRTMLLDVVSNLDKDNFTTVIGKLTLTATEDLEDTSKLRTVPFEVMFIDKDPEKAVGSVLAHLNALPLRFGDSMFEIGFFELLAGNNVETGDGETKQ